MSLIKSTATIGFYTLISRVLGYIRDVTIASSLGASMLSDAFFVAFKIPNFFRRLFAEGAFNSAFVPQYAGMLATKGREEAQAFASSSLSFLVAVLILLCIVFIAFMPWMMVGLAPGFSDDPEKYDLTVLLTRITFPYILFMSVVCLLGGILNSIGKFAAVAATPILMNICLIIIPTLIAPLTPTEAHGLAVAVFVAGVVQMVWLIIHCMKLGVLPKLRLPHFTPQVKRLLILIAPAALGAGVAQINLFVDLIIASHLDNAVSYLYYADRLNELPLAVIGIGVGTALLPMLSRQVREKKFTEARVSQNRAIEIALLLALPAAAALIAMAEPIIRVMFERGEFTATHTSAVAPALMAFAAGLPAFVLAKVLSPMFYAHEDTKTPFLIAAVCIVVNLVLNLALMGPLAHVGMALATAIAAWVNVIMMLIILKRRDMFVLDKFLLKRAPRTLLACMAMVVALYALLPQLQPLLVAAFVWQITGVSLLVAAGMMVFAMSAWLLGAVDKAEMKRALRRRR